MMMMMVMMMMMDEDDDDDDDDDDRDRIAWQAASAQYNLRTQYRLGAAIKK